VRTTARNIRLFKARLQPRPNGSAIEIVGEWVYALDDVSTLQAVGATDVVTVADLRVSEMMRLEGERFLVVERTDQATALYEIDLDEATNIYNTRWDDAATLPTLEQTNDLAAAGIRPVSKKLRFIASSLAGAQPRFAEKIEGLALTNRDELIIVNDDDFGILDQRIRVDVVRGAGFGGPER
jgi:hypothetical protein